MDLPELTLGDLLDLPDLGLTLLCGGDAARARPVAGAHSIEGDSPARWLDRGWIMLTTGLGLSDDAAGQRTLVRELDDAGACALGFGLGAALHEVPAAVLDEARSQDFPVFLVGDGTPFRQVIGAVFRATLSREIRASNRLAAMQRFLLEALGEENPRTTAIERLATLISSSVAVLRADGTVEIATGPLPAGEIAAEIRARAGAVVPFALPTHHGAAFALGAPGTAGGRWLITAVPSGRAQDPLTVPAAHATVPLLLAMDHLDRARRAQEVAVRRATLLSALDSRDPYEAPILAARLAASDIDVAHGAVVLAIGPAQGSDKAEASLARLEEALADAAVPFLGAVRDGRVAALLASPVEDDLLDGLPAEVGPGMHLGVAPVVDDALALPWAWSAAVVAVDAASKSGAPVVHYDALTLPEVVLSEVANDRLATKIASWLEPLDEHPPIRQTLRAYLDRGFDIAATAQALHLHPNSVRYRLHRAEQLLGVSLRCADTIVALHVALRSGPPARHGSQETGT